ncbi:hypothetical protein [Haloferula sp.]|uniref:hypothetical protein n=1 Tax=Haloferula sp. TaxID=2497595 RepID=UPI003C762364
MKEIVDIGILIVTCLMMFSVGLEIVKDLLVGLFGREHRIFPLLLAQLLLPPLAGLAVAKLFHLPPHLACALLLVAACPIGDIANAYTLISRGNPAASLFLNTVTCAVAPLSMAACFIGYRYFGYEDESFAIPGWVFVGRLLAILVIPTLIGIFIRTRMPDLAIGIRKPVHRLVTLGILLLLIYVIFAQRQRILEEGLIIAASSLAFMLIVLLAGVAFLKQLPVDPRTARASLLALPVRNIGVASLISITMLGQIDYAGFAAVYFLAEVPLLLLLAWLLRRPFFGKIIACSSSPR